MVPALASDEVHASSIQTALFFLDHIELQAAFTCVLGDHVDGHSSLHILSIT